MPDEKIVVYTDSSCQNNGKMNTRCRSGIWLKEGSQQNQAIRVPGPNQLNQIGEIMAVIVALEKLPNYVPLMIKTDSQYVIDGLTIHLNEWEDKGWIGIKNKDWLKRAAYLLRKQTAPTRFKWVKGHSGDLGNEQSDQLAKLGANKEEADEISLNIPEHFDLQGAKLSTITQAIAYKGINEQEAKNQRRTTHLNLKKVRSNIKSQTGMLETNEALWGLIRKSPVRLKIRQFFYKALHGTQKVGRYWFNIQNYEERRICQNCNDNETMDHILVGCKEKTKSIIWNCAEELWPYKEGTWPGISLGTIIGCNALNVETSKETKDGQGQSKIVKRSDQGATRLLKILISESAYMIWMLRCERIISGQERTEREIKAIWREGINRRLTEDKITATKVLRRKII